MKYIKIWECLLLSWYFFFVSSTIIKFFLIYKRIIEYKYLEIIWYKDLHFQKSKISFNVTWWSRQKWSRFLCIWVSFQWFPLCHLAFQNTLFIYVSFLTYAQNFYLCEFFNLCPKLYLWLLFTLLPQQQLQPNVFLFNPNSVIIHLYFPQSMTSKTNLVSMSSTTSFKWRKTFCPGHDQIQNPKTPRNG